jgi:quinoprotein glucose dehydrogenase
MRTLVKTLLFTAALRIAIAQTDWPIYGHDPGGLQYSPLNQINTRNVTRLQVAWTYDARPPVTPSPPATASAPPAPSTPPASSIPIAPAAPGAEAPRPARPRTSEASPLVVGGVLYLGTPYSRVVALDPETGTKIWEYESDSAPSTRGIAYWAGDRLLAPQVVVSTMNGWLYTLNAKTGKLNPGFGNEGKVNLRVGVADKFPRGRYGPSSPPAIYKNLIFTGAQLQEEPANGPSGDIRAWDIHSGKLVWTFHTIPHPGERNHEVWQEDQWPDRSGANAWGFMTVDVQRGMLFIPLGTPTPDFYGGSRKGSNLYGSTLVALDAATGQIKWYFQTTHHDNWDYDLTAAPCLIEVTRGSKKIPAVAQWTKQGLLFIFNRLTGEPIYKVEERPVLSDNPNPGDENWPTQPFPVKPPPLARMTFQLDEVAKVTPEHEAYCKGLLALEGGAIGGGPYAQYGPKLRVIFPGWVGGGNWSTPAFNPELGYIYVTSQDMGNLNKMTPSADGLKYKRVAGAGAPTNSDGRFWDGPRKWPCQKPPWGEIIAVNVNTGDVAWREPLGSFDELDALGVPKTGTPEHRGGPIATAGGLLFIGATIDARFRALDARTGKELWVTKLADSAKAMPITYQGKNGKQYVAIFAAGGEVRGPENPGGRLYVFALP